MNFIESDNIVDIYKKLASKLKDAKEIVYKGKKKLKNIRDNYIILNDIRNSIIYKKVNENYLMKELTWYLYGDQSLNAMEKFKVWKNCANDKGEVNSNYGKIIFHDEINQLKFVINELKKFKDSRRAIININQPIHKSNPNTKDFPCTVSIHFVPRESKYLDCYVYMRSNDLIYGFPYNIIFFIALQACIIMILDYSTDGSRYIHITPDIHVYEKHYNMLDDIMKFDNKINHNLMRDYIFRLFHFLKTWEKL